MSFIGSTGVSTLGLMVVILISMAYLFAKDEAARFLTGLLRTVIMLLTRPIEYLARSVHALARLGGRGQAYEQSDQYLLNAVLITLQAGIVVLAAAIPAVGLIRAWKAFIPPKDLREDVRITRAALQSQKEELARLTSDLVRLDDAWRKVRDNEIAAARAPLLQAISVADNDLQRMEKTAREWGGEVATAFQRLQERAAAYPPRDDEDAPRRGRAVLDRFLATDGQSLSDEDLSLAKAWVSRWETKLSAQYANSTITEDSIRIRKQPAAASARQRRSVLERTVPEKEGELRTLEEAAELRFGAALLELTKMVGSFFGAIWVYGLLLEALWLGVHAADDLKRLRVSAEQLQTVEKSDVDQRSRWHSHHGASPDSRSAAQ